MRNLTVHPVTPEETIRALLAQSDTISAKDLEDMRLGNMTPYLLKVAADFIAANPSLFREHVSKSG